MAFETYSRGNAAVALTVRWAGRPRTLKLNRGAAIALVGLLPVLAIWYLCATAYFVFHDQLLASLITRQTDMQYAYEDRIAALKTQLDREAGRAMLDRNTLDTTVRDLAARGVRLEGRAVAMETLVAESLHPTADRSPTTRSPAVSLQGIGNPLVGQAPAQPSDVSAYDAAAAPTAPLNPEPASSTESGSPRDRGGRPDSRADLSPERLIDAVSGRLDRVETKQSQAVARLRDPMIRDVERMRIALAETGLSPSRWQTRPGQGVGGPFVPLPVDAAESNFGQTIELLRDAVLQRARLSEIVDRVPLRKPVDGPLEVTSTFGPRLDPFLGRPAMHTGIDLYEGYGDKVQATATGTVTIAGREGGYGNMVEIEHGDGLSTRYAHLSSIDVAVHQRIAVGDIVGKVGSTGRATGPHLHYETRINGEAVDPARFLKAGSGLFPG